MFRLLIKCLLLLQLIYFVNHHQFVAEATQSELHERMSKIEATNLQQAREISLLKTNAVEDKKEIHQLKNRVALLEASALTNSTTEITKGRQKRPARLLPAKYFR